MTVIIDFLNSFVAVPELMREFLQTTTMLSGRAFGRVPGKLAVQALNVALRATTVSPRFFFMLFCVVYCFEHQHPRLLTNTENVIPRRDFSKVTDNQATELYFEEIFEQGFASGDPLFDLRNYFYPESEVLCLKQTRNV